MQIAVDNSWTAQYKRARLAGDVQEIERCMTNYQQGVRNPPSVFYKERCFLQREANYQSRVSSFTEEEKIQACSDFMERMYRVPGAGACTTLLQLRKNAWNHLRHSHFFLKHYNPYVPELAKIIL
jgi:hypothetical protein